MARRSHRGSGATATTTPSQSRRDASRLWRAAVPEIATDSSVLERSLQRSSEDLGALRMFDQDHPDLAVVAAGAPWFMTVFGRDSLLTGWMSLLADHTLAHGVLETLARFQGVDVDPSTEEEPGKILHEMRFLSADAPGLDQASIYYGSIDATPSVRDAAGRAPALGSLRRDRRAALAPCGPSLGLDRRIR